MESRDHTRDLWPPPTSIKMHPHGPENSHLLLLRKSHYLQNSTGKIVAFSNQMDIKVLQTSQVHRAMPSGGVGWTPYAARGYGLLCINRIWFESLSCTVSSQKGCYHSLIPSSFRGLNLRIEVHVMWGNVLACKSDPMNASSAETKRSPHAIGEICLLDTSVSFSTHSPRLLTLSALYPGPLLWYTGQGKH